MSTTTRHAPAPNPAVTSLKAKSNRVLAQRRWHGDNPDHPALREAESVLAQCRIEQAITANRAKLSEPARAALAADLMRAE